MHVLYNSAIQSKNVTLMLNHLGRTHSSQKTASRSALARIFQKFAPMLLVLGILGLGWLAVHEIQSESTPLGSAPEEVRDETSVIRLPPGKLASGNFHCEAVEEQLIQMQHDVPGRIQYDESKHIEVKVSMDGVLAELLVKPGDQVQRDQLLAVIKSPEIGQARSEVLRRQQQLEIVEQKLNRERDLSKNLYEFFDQLDQEKSDSDIDDVFENRPLGSFRKELLSAYSQLRLARSLIENGKTLGNTGAISGRTLRERESELAIAQAAFRTIRDQSAFASKQAKLQAEADVEDAQRQYDLAKQSLEALLGYPEEVDSVKSVDALSRLEIHAPFASTVESRQRSQGERINKNDTLIVLADTSTLYVAADVRETEWKAVAQNPGTSLSVNVPALDHRELKATLHYIGREVTGNSNAIPIIATIDNSEGWLRPGMFVRVAIPFGVPRKALAVKPKSIVQHEDKQFVFIKIDEATFQRVDVSTGIASKDWVEIREGLTPGQVVVDEGAFLLKSELLLEGESE
jgi:membrane fusion protein, heavy metal efflux system